MRDQNITEGIGNPLHKHDHDSINQVIHELKHYLPAQAPLKDFIHHNTLHAFQHMKFSDAIIHASEMFGYNVSLSLNDYRNLYDKGKINEKIFDQVITNRKGAQALKEWKNKALFSQLKNETLPRIGSLRANWKKLYKVDLDSLVHPTLFRILCCYLDQGISIWNFPVWHKGFLSSIRELERNSFTSFFRTKSARQLLIETPSLSTLLMKVVGDKSLYKQYLFDQQFAHQGWSGIVSVVEDHPYTLLDHKRITLNEVILLELILEIDALEYHFGENWLPLSARMTDRPIDLFENVSPTESREVYYLFQEALEWTYYDEVLRGIVSTPPDEQVSVKNFQAMFCLDDRECSLRRHIEKMDPHCETFGTPGFFNVEFFFQPQNGKFYTKLCPAPIHPRHLIKEAGSKARRDQDLHLHKHSHTLFRGWLISQTLGFIAAFKLFISIFRPSASPATASSFQHMDRVARLTIENRNPAHREKDLQIGFTIEEMALRVEGLLKSIGLVKNFAPIVYVIGHGSSTVNNPHYAAYDCGACSGRPGSVNARVFSFMANHPKVREKLRERDINIPETTQFVGGLHDTTRDEIGFYDEQLLSKENAALHLKNEETFLGALKINAKERSRRFMSTDSKQDLEHVHEEVKKRSFSLFEPRPEYNHATNTLCIIGRRELTKHLFLDRRAFLNSYDYRIDPEGKYLLNILKAAAPVCGGINLEYFFSRVDNQKLGAGTKLPHNVMGLVGVANGIEGDLRPGLPSQMIEIHDPIRLLTIVEQSPEVVLNTIRSNEPTYEWFRNEWIHLVVIEPETRNLFVFRDGGFHLYQPVRKSVSAVPDILQVIESSDENLPVMLID